MPTYLESAEAQRKKREGQPIVRPWVDRTRQEFAEMSGRAFSGSPEGRQIYEQGRDAIMRGPQNPFGGKTAYGTAEEVGRGVQSAKDWVGRIPGRLASMSEAKSIEAEGPVARSRRLEQAGLPSEATRRPAMPQEPPDTPVMAESQRTGNRSEADRFKGVSPEQAAYGVGQQPDERTMPGKTGQAVATSTATRVSGPTAAPSSDPRARYMSMAKMGLEEREKYLNSLPTGQRPIQVIRGNQESWYSPGMSREFATIPEAMSGIQGRPTYESEEARAERGAGRAAVSSRQSARFAHERAMKQDEFSQEEKMARDYGVGIRGGKGGGTGRGLSGEEFIFGPAQTLDDGSAYVPVLDKKSGKSFQIKYGDTKAADQLLTTLNMEDSGSRQIGLNVFRNLDDQAAQNKILENMPNHVKDALLLAIQENKNQENKK